LLRVKVGSFEATSHADCLADLAIRWLLGDLDEPGQAVTAVSHVVDLVTLAGKVASLYGNCGIRVPEQSTLNSSTYSASTISFLAMLESLRMGVPSLEHQILDTALAFPTYSGGPECPDLLT
jgi:hypothetical protein